MANRQIPAPLKKGREGYPWTTTPEIADPNLSYPKISIVTPSFQQGEFLEETIRSVLMQGYPNLEYLVLDGGSTDESTEVINYYADFISFSVSEKDDGQADAISRGFARASGDILGWLNSDDILLPRSLLTIAKHFMADDRVKCVTGLRKVFDDNSTPLYNWYFGRPTSEYIQHICVIFQETTYWRREVWETIGNINPTFHFAMDYEYWQRILEAGYEFTLIKEYLGGFRVHGKSKYSTRRQLRTEELQRIYQHYKIAKNEEEAVRRYMRQYDANWSRSKHFLIKVGHSSLSNSPNFMILLGDFLKIPLLSTIVLRFYSFFRRLQGRHYE